MEQWVSHFCGRIQACLDTIEELRGFVRGLKYAINDIMKSLIGNDISNMRAKMD